MARILGVDLPAEKRIDVALRYLFGIGKTLADKVLAETSIPPEKRAKDLSDQEISQITRIIQEKYRIEGDLRREIAANIKRLVSIGTWRGSRHRKGLPVRGQRTRTNARTRKGPRKTVGVTKIKATRTDAGGAQKAE